jgi:hypothetical protein
MDPLLDVCVREPSHGPTCQRKAGWREGGSEGGREEGRVHDRLSHINTLRGSNYNQKNSYKIKHACHNYR